MVREVRVALAGFGNVGRHFAALLEEKAGFLRSGYGLDLRLVAIIDLKGSVFDRDGTIGSDRAIGLDGASITGLPTGVDGILAHPATMPGLTGLLPTLLRMLLPTLLPTLTLPLTPRPQSPPAWPLWRSLAMIRWPQST